MSTSRMRGTFVSVDRLVGEQARGEDRQRAVLVARRRGAARRADAPPSITNDSATGLTMVEDTSAHYASQACESDPRTGLGDAHARTRRARRCCATRSPSRPRRRRTRARFGEDEELWRVTALLHDFDYEIHPTLDKHPQDGAPILREEGYPEVVIDAVLSHANHLAMPRDTPLKKSLFACDELSGLRARVRARPADGPRGARAEVGQEEAEAAVVRGGRLARRRLRGRRAARLELDEHIANVVEALQPIAGELGLRTEAA